MKRTESIRTKESQTMFKKALAGFGAMLAVVMLIAATSGYGTRRAAAEAEINSEPMEVQPATDGGFSVEVLINGVPAEEYAARGRRYIEAFENAEYELRIRNPYGVTRRSCAGGGRS